MSKTDSCFLKGTKTKPAATKQPPNECFLSTAARQYFHFRVERNFVAEGVFFELTERRFKAFAIAVIAASLNLAYDYLQLFICKGVKKKVTLYELGDTSFVCTWF